MNKEIILFESPGDFRAWLSENASHEGIWLKFLKGKGAKSITATEALKEALCFGWIDGVLESIDEKSYRKYFAPRSPKSRWSEKNIKLVSELEASGKMTDYGRAAIEISKKNGMFEAQPREQISEEKINMLYDALKPYEKALANLTAMPKSAQRAYTGDFLSVKTDAGREKKLARLVERLEMNLNPMESMAKKKSQE